MNIESLFAFRTARVPVPTVRQADRAAPLRTEPRGLHVHTQGQGREAVVCLHASAGDHTQWSALANGLAAQAAGDFRVISPDLYGHGRSPAWPARAARTLDADADAVMHTVRAHGAAGQGLHLVGHSYGAALALQIALCHPHRVRSLALYEPLSLGVLRTMLRDDPSRAAANEVAQAVARLLHDGRRVEAARHYVGYWGGDAAWHTLPGPLREQICTHVDQLPRHHDALYAATWSATLLRSVQAPVLLMHGAATCTPADRIVRCLSYVLPCLQRLEFAGAGHLGPITHPAAVNAAIMRHLKRVAAPTTPSALREVDVDLALA